MKAIAVICFSLIATSLHASTPKEIFEANKAATVRVFADGHLAGCGFVVSPDGLVVTANHVITTRESDFTQPVGVVEVQILDGPGKGSHTAAIVDHSTVFDTALLRIIAIDLVSTKIGDPKSVEPSAVIAAITLLPGSTSPLLLTGTVSGKGNVTAGKINAQALVFQMPIRKGFSGSPVFDDKGFVVGIVSTRLIGISDDLAIARKQLERAGGQVQIVTVDVTKTFVDLIDNLDADLVSGLGSAVSISYAQTMIEKAHSQKEQNSNAASHK